MAQGKTVNKVVTAMTSAQNQHGGQEAIPDIDDALGRDKMHHQCIQIGSGGNPYATNVTVGQDGKMIEDVEATVKAKRTITVAESVKKEHNERVTISKDKPYWF